MVLWDFKYDRKANSVAYIHIITEPFQIYEQRLSDNEAKKKERENTTLDSIAKHQEISLIKTIEIAKELSSDLLVIYNQPRNLEKNLMTMDTFFNHYFKENYKKACSYKKRKED
ncbi:MAG: hypothetical protein U9Q69_04325 [Nanoarchaeota archaeon]|nr:hypothetical protein [Nanoarchaeota archaeon]